MRNSPLKIGEAEILQATMRAEQYLRFLNDYRSEFHRLFKGNKAIEVDEAALCDRYGIPHSIWIPDREAALEQGETILEQVAQWTSGEMSPEDIQSMLFSFDEALDIDYTFIFLGQPIRTVLIGEANELIERLGSRFLPESSVEASL